MNFFFIRWVVAINWLFIVSVIFKTCTMHTNTYIYMRCVYRSAPNNDNDDFQFVQRKKSVCFFLCYFIILFGVLIFDREGVFYMLVIFVALLLNVHRHSCLIIIQKDQSVLFIGKLVYIEFFTLAFDSV